VAIGFLKGGDGDLDKEKLRGYLVSVPIPWEGGGKLSEDALRRATRKLLDEGCDGIYVFGTSGEGYAVTEGEFERITTIFAEETRDRGVFRQVGCFGLSSDQVKARCAVVRDQGIEGVQITLPFWKELSDAELLTFFKDVCGSFPDLSFLLYNSPRNKRKLTGAEMTEVQRVAPNMHGAKTGSGSWLDFLELVMESPGVRHFVTEPAFLFCYPLGAAGLIPSSNYCRPKRCRKYYEAVIHGRFDEASALHREITRFFHGTATPLVKKGYIDGAIDKAYAAIGGMDIPLTMKSPYKALSAEDLSRLEKVIKEEFPGE